MLGKRADGRWPGIQGCAKEKIRLLATRVVAEKGTSDARWNEVARRANDLKQDVIKEYFKRGRAARDYYKRALEVAAEEAALQEGVQQRPFAQPDVEAWHAETDKLERQEKVSHMYGPSWLLQKWAD